MALATVLARLRRASWRSRWLAWQAAMTLTCAALCVRLLPWRRTVALWRLSPGPAPLAATSEPQRLHEVVEAVAAVAALTPWESTCLMKALAGSSLLRRRGIASTTILGVAKLDRLTARAEAFAAHAWLRCGDEVLIGGDQSERFTPVATYSTSPK